MTKTWVIAFLAVITITSGACSAATAAETSDKRPVKPVVSSSDYGLWGSVVTINEYKYNCIRSASNGGVWCDRLVP